MKTRKGLFYILLPLVLLLGFYYTTTQLMDDVEYNVTVEKGKDSYLDDVKVVGEYRFFDLSKRPAVYTFLIDQKKVERIDERLDDIDPRYVMTTGNYSSQELVDEKELAYYQSLLKDDRYDEIYQMNSYNLYFQVRDGMGHQQTLRKIKVYPDDSIGLIQTQSEQGSFDEYIVDKEKNTYLKISDVSLDLHALRSERYIILPAIDVIDQKAVLMKYENQSYKEICTLDFDDPVRMLGENKDEIYLFVEKDDQLYRQIYDTKGTLLSEDVVCKEVQHAILEGATNKTNTDILFADDAVHVYDFKTNKIIHTYDSFITENYEHDKDGTELMDYWYQQDALYVMKMEHQDLVIRAYDEEEEVFVVRYRILSYTLKDHGMQDVAYGFMRWQL